MDQVATLLGRGVQKQQIDVSLRVSVFLSWLICFALFFFFFPLNTFTIILLKGSYDLVRWIDFFDIIDTQDW